MTGTLAEVVVAVGRSLELSILGKATAWVVLGLLAASIARRAKASTRHLLLAAVFVGLLAMPMAFVAIPPVAIPVPIPDAASWLQASDATTSPGRTGAVGGPARDGALPLPRWTAVVQAVWLGGVLVLMIPAAGARRRLARVRRYGLPWLDVLPLTSALIAEAGVSRPIDVLLHEDVVTPMTCGFRRPAILLPSDAPQWSDRDLRRALVHEIEHVRRGDWTVHLLAHATCVLYWFHPLVWIARRRLALEAERACDDAVLRGADRTEYAAQLVDLARRLSAVPGRTLAMANRSDLSARVSAILDATQRRGRLDRAPATAVVALAAIAAVSIAPVRAVSMLALPASVAAQQAGAEDAAQAAAEAWLKMVDEDRYGASWKEAASAFRSAVTEARWTEMVTGVREPLGKLVSRTVKSRKYTEELPGAPDGQYVVIQFDTVFANKASAVETVTPMRDPDGTWRVAGYYIR